MPNATCAYRPLLWAIGLVLGNSLIGYAADPPVSIEIAVESGFEVAGQQRWMDFLNESHFTSLRFRGARASDEPLIENRGTDESPRYAITALLTADNKLILPGQIVRYGQRKELISWLEKLRRGGEQGVTETVGLFGLTSKQLATLHEALKQPVSSSTQDETLRTFLEQTKRTLTVPLEIDSSARQAMEADAKVLDELQGLSCGTALVAAVRPYGLLVTPTGQGTRSVGVRITKTGQVEDAWPLGTTSKKSPGELVPDLFKFVNVEINDRPLSEAVEAIQGRVQIPLLYDHNALALHEVDLNKHVNLPPARTFYKKILDQLLFQMLLRSELRVDEGGRPFLWVTSAKR